MADKKSRSRSITPGAKGDITVGTSATSSAVLNVGTNGQVLTADSTQTSGVKWGTVNAPIVWTNRLQTGGQNVNVIAYNGSNLYVVGGNSGGLWTSPDGITWTSRTSGFGTNQINDITYGNGLWVAVGGNGTITTSSDGITWTARTANMGTNLLYAVQYANSLWVAVGAGGGTVNTGGITYSSDGLTWTRKSQSLTVGPNYSCVVWNGTNWIIGADVSTNNYLYASTPSGTWTAGADGTSSAIRGIWWDGTRMWNFNGIPNYCYSTRLTLGTVTTISNPTGISYYNRNMNVQSKIYSGNMYIASTPNTISGFVLSSSTTPITLPASWNPGMWTTGSGTISGAQNTALYVGSVGQIVGDNYGQLWTSF